MDTLEAEGYAYHVDGRYYLTRRWQQEGQVVADHDQLSARFRPILESLQAQVRETLILAQRAGDEVVYLDVVEGGQVLRFAAHVGQRKPLHASASGRALLGALDDAELLPLLDGLDYPRCTDATPATAARLLAVIREERRRGWHLNLGEYQADTLSVAAPVVLHGLVLALVVGAPISRAGHKVEAIGAALVAAAAQARRDL
jgi:DNA-binding IclR family transcriptional regulator